MENLSVIIFKSRQHEIFYNRYLQKCRCKDVYHRALVYCLGIDRDTREHIDRIYDFNTGLVKPECLHEGWQTSGSAKIVRLAFNLYCNGMPGIEDGMKEDEMLRECQLYTVEEIFCSGYARYFWEAVKIRYPDECSYMDWEDICGENREDISE